ncbi:hypothetical protein MFIFM68171_02563 [Madurella fahalii]|uniref:Uncharacterized protein n=1 Tax=Madurella fahalii TaxID=1157608 RepID=A0ABQ0G3L0_9PEZI
MWEKKVKEIDLKIPNTENWLFEEGIALSTRDVKIFREWLNKVLSLEEPVKLKGWEAWDRSRGRQPKYTGPVTNWEDIISANFTIKEALYKSLQTEDETLDWSKDAASSEWFARLAHGQAHVLMPREADFAYPYGGQYESFWQDFELWHLTHPQGRIDKIWRWDPDYLGKGPRLAFDRHSDDPKLNKQIGTKPTYDGKGSEYPKKPKDGDIPSSTLHVKGPPSSPKLPGLEDLRPNPKKRPAPSQDMDEPRWGQPVEPLPRKKGKTTKHN